MLLSNVLEVVPSKWSFVLLLLRNRYFLYAAFTTLVIPAVNTWHLLWGTLIGVFGCLLTLYLNSGSSSGLQYQEKSRFVIRADQKNEHDIPEKDDFDKMKPLMFPCRVSHMRSVPKSHLFSYSYLMVGIPIGWRGSIGRFLSADLESLRRQGSKIASTWFTVKSADHLGRGDDINGLEGKLATYLNSIVSSSTCPVLQRVLRYITE